MPLRALKHSRPIRGFTLIELVAALVIVGAIAAVALPIFRDLRYDARVASLEGIRSSIVANANLARSAWLAGSGGATVRVNGRTIDVFPADTGLGFGGWMLVPGGAPTPAGMFAMLGCDPADFVSTWTPMRCAGLPGYLITADQGSLALWPETLAATWADAWCAIIYSPTAGHDPDVGLGTPPGDPYYTVFQSSEAYYWPASEVAGGC